MIRIIVRQKLKYLIKGKITLRFFADPILISLPPSRTSEMRECRKIPHNDEQKQLAQQQQRHQYLSHLFQFLFALLNFPHLHRI